MLFYFSLFIFKSIEHDAAVSSLTNDPRLVGELLVICLSQSDPLIPADMYDSVLLTTSKLKLFSKTKQKMNYQTKTLALQNHSDKVKYLQETIARVPSPVKKTLIELLSLLKTLNFSASHKAKSQDLAKIFGRLLLRPKERLFYMEHDQEQIQLLTKMLIEEKMA